MVYSNPKKENCFWCGKEYYKLKWNHRFCSTKCRSAYHYLFKTKNSEFKKLINDIRVNYDFMRIHFPEKAKKIIKKMEKEESKEFIKFALNGFKNLEIR